MKSPKIRVVFVCLGNICRSPLAEGAFRAHITRRGISERFEVDSAGTSGHHDGEAPDPRSIYVAERNGIDITTQKSRKFLGSDLANFDYVIGMDRSNMRNIARLKNHNSTAQMSMMLDELGTLERDVPDPYYGGAQGFDDVWSMVDEACARLLDRILEENS